MSCDDRIEVRIPGGDKAALTLRANAEGVTLSMLLRRAARLLMGQPLRLEAQQALEVMALRRRINAIDARLEAMGIVTPAMAAIQADLAQAHVDAQTLLGR